MKKIKVGIVGGGMITARRHAPEYKSNPNVEIAGFFDANKDRAKELVAGYGGKVYDSVEELLTDPEIDAVSICSPNFTHAEYSIMALENGKHVLCEKPMASNLEETKEMIETAKRVDKKLMIGHNQRILPTHKKSKELLESGAIGKILFIQSSFKHSGPENWSISRSNKTWFFDKKQAHFGVLADLGAHKLDIIRFLAGDEVDDICCSVKTLDKKYEDGSLIDLEDNAACLFNMRNGIFGSMHVSWTNYGEEDNSTIIYGDKGVMKIFGDFADDIVIEMKDGTRVKYEVGRISTNEKQIKSGVIDDFVDSIVNDHVPSVEGEDGHNTLAVIVAAINSAKERKWVDVKY